MPQQVIRGVGIGLRRDYEQELATSTRTLDWLEIVPENFVGVGGARRRALEKCRERWSIVPHGVSLSLGGPDPLDFAYLRRLRELLDWLEAPFYTDHLCYSSLGGLFPQDLLPLPFTEEAVRHVASRIRMVADALERPIAVENITYYATMPGSRLSEGAFVSAVVAEADCDLLLDLNNVYVNARNHGLDPHEVLWALPVTRARQIHLAGFWPEEGRLIDDHGAPVADEVWDLYRDVVARLGPIPTLIEWDNRIPPLERVLDEADRARSIVKGLEACA